VHSRNGAAIVLVHGGGGDRQGTILHARMLAKEGYGVLLYDARGRGESAGHENAFGWQWDRDVHGAVSYLTRRGIHRIGLLGISTGAEAVVAEESRMVEVGAVRRRYDLDRRHAQRHRVHMDQGRSVVELDRSRDPVEDRAAPVLQGLRRINTSSRAA
jgi:predicted alpha/beta-fold hydrolase